MRLPVVFLKRYNARNHPAATGDVDRANRVDGRSACVALLLGDYMTVAEFIDYLKTQPQGIRVAYRRYSEQCLLETEDIEIEDLCHPRPDGWIQDKRPDMETEQYLVLPGN